MKPALALARTSAGAVATVAGTLSGVAFLILFAVNLAQIALRTFGEGGWIWVTDLSQLLFVWMVMLGTVAAYHARDHIVVDFLIAGFTGVREVVIATAIRVIEIALFVLLFLGGFDVAVNRAGFSYVQLGIPTSWGYAAIPIAAVLLVLIALALPLRFPRQEADDEIADAATPDGASTDDPEDSR